MANLITDNLSILLHWVTTTYEVGGGAHRVLTVFNMLLFCS